MPIIGNVGRKSVKVRMLQGFIHLVLLTGGITMVYPFLIMVSGSFKSEVDRRGLHVVPRYWYDDEMLYRKWIESKHNTKTLSHHMVYREFVPTFEKVTFPKRPVEKRYLDWNEFVEANKAGFAEFHRLVGHCTSKKVKPELQRVFVAELKADPEINGILDNVNKKYGTNFVDWDQIQINDTHFLGRASTGHMERIMRHMINFGAKQPESYQRYFSIDSFFVINRLKPKYPKGVRQMNQACKGICKYAAVAERAKDSEAKTVLEAQGKLCKADPESPCKTNFQSWEDVTLARRMPEGGLKKQWEFFVKKRLNLQFIQADDEALPAWHAYLKIHYEGNIKNFNKVYGTSYTSASQIAVPLIREVPRTGARLADWMLFVTIPHILDPDAAAKSESKPNKGVDPKHLSIVTTEFMYRDFLKNKYTDFSTVLEAHEFGLQNIAELALTRKKPRDNLAYESDWIDFVDNEADRDWVHPDYAASKLWMEFLAKGEGMIKNKDAEKIEDKYDLALFNATYDTKYKNMRDITVSATKPDNPQLAVEWRKFIDLKEADGGCPRKLLILDVAKARSAWHTFIAGKYKDVAALNNHYGYTPKSFETVAMPIADVDYYGFQEIKSDAKWEFIKRNYAMVFELMLYSGRAITNTLIYVFLAVASALIINPMAAYALSRYKPPSQYKLLLFLMLTMAFPPMVLTIPNFLLMRQLNLFNTFAALILPGMANGYSIFLLKGFFDSLPRELYESAQIDGATEWVMFWQITMSTSKPILAVIGLRAFTLAYGNFMMAFLVCQDRKMWTMMVHIYTLMMRAGQGVSFAALVIAALPTLTMFIFCQNLIMRGIVVPTEK
jgi:ABC-type glycerol-3-phosphate transport system permease component